MVHLIKYELKGYRPRVVYQRVEDEIKAIGPWCHIPESTWLVETELPTKQVAGRLAPLTVVGDTIFVTRIYRDWFSYSLTQDQIDWLHGRNFGSLWDIVAALAPVPRLPFPRP